MGIQAVQEIAAALAHYEADEAWIVTNRDFMAAYCLAKSKNVKLINRTRLIKLILKMNPEAVPEPKQMMVEVSAKPIQCEQCGRPMVLRKGPRGKFYRCNGFPKCRFTRSAEDIE